MKRKKPRIAWFAGLVLGGFVVSAAASGEPVKALVLVGGHGYDRKGFETLWEGFEGITHDVWPGSPYAAFDDIETFAHDVIVMYNLSSGITETQKRNFLKLLEKGTGLVVWHHALANCQDWPEFEKIAGGKFWMKPGTRDGQPVPKSGTGFGEIRMHVEDTVHPVTRGMADYLLTDESYNRQTFIDGIRILVGGTHPKSDQPIAWVNAYGKARVFTCQSGHDAKAWRNASFQRLLSRGIRWAAGRLPDDAPGATGSGATVPN